MKELSIHLCINTFTTTQSTSSANKSLNMKMLLAWWALSNPLRPSSLANFLDRKMLEANKQHIQNLHYNNPYKNFESILLTQIKSTQKVLRSHRQHINIVNVFDCSNDTSMILILISADCWTKKLSLEAVCGAEPVLAHSGNLGDHKNYTWSASIERPPPFFVVVHL